MAVAALGHPEEPSKADLPRALQQLQDQVMAQFAEFRQMLNALPDPSSLGRTIEPLPQDLDAMLPMRGFLMEDPE